MAKEQLKSKKQELDEIRDDVLEVELRARFYKADADLQESLFRTKDFYLKHRVIKDQYAKAVEEDNKAMMEKLEVLKKEQSALKDNTDAKDELSDLITSPTLDVVES